MIPSAGGRCSSEPLPLLLPWVKNSFAFLPLSSVSIPFLCSLSPLSLSLIVPANFAFPLSLSSSLSGVCMGKGTHEFSALVHVRERRKLPINRLKLRKIVFAKYVFFAAGSNDFRFDTPKNIKI